MAAAKHVVVLLLNAIMSDLLVLKYTYEFEVPCGLIDDITYDGLHPNMRRKGNDQFGIKGSIDIRVSLY
jgi:hypothetical protein